MSVTHSIEIVNGAGDAFGRTEDGDFNGVSLRFRGRSIGNRRFGIGSLGRVGNKVFCHGDLPAFLLGICVELCQHPEFDPSVELCQHLRGHEPLTQSKAWEKQEQC